MVAAAGAGPDPIPHQELSADILAEGIRYCFTDQAITAASTIAIKMASETGVQAAVSSFHQHLPLERLSCDICPGEPAVWSYSSGDTKVKLSKVGAAALVAQNLIDAKRLKLYVKPLLPWSYVINRYSDMHSTPLELKIVDGTLSQGELLPLWEPRQTLLIPSWDCSPNPMRNTKTTK